VHRNRSTQANLSLIPSPAWQWAVIGPSSTEAFTKPDGSFIYLRGDVSHTHDLKDGSQLFGKVQGNFRASRW
jgi:hypothetical protein